MCRSTRNLLRDTSWPSWFKASSGKIVYVGHFRISLALAALNSNQAAAQLLPLEQESQAALLSARVMDRYQYLHTELDDRLSAKIFDNYMKALDDDKVFFRPRADVQLQHEPIVPVNQ